MTNDHNHAKRQISEEKRADLTARFTALDESRDPFGRDDPALAAMADQILTGIVSLHQWVEDYLSGLGREALAVEIAGEGHAQPIYKDKDCGRGFAKLRALADRAFEAYNHVFASLSGEPESTPVGYTDESADLSTGMTPDTRVYAIRARFPLERTPILSQAEFNDYAESVRKEPSCDLQINGPSCNQMLERLHHKGKFDFLLSYTDYDGYPNVVPVPYVRGDVVVWLSICRDCWNFYCFKYEISKPEIVGPDDGID